MQNRLIRLIGMVFSNSTMLSVSDKSDTVNERIQDINKLMKLHIQGMWQNAHKFIRQLAHGDDSADVQVNDHQKGVFHIMHMS